MFISQDVMLYITSKKTRSVPAKKVVPERSILTEKKETKTMKKMLPLALMMMSVPAAAEETAAAWAYGAMPLNNGNVGTIYYTAAYYQLEGIVNPANPAYAPYTAEEIAAIVKGAADGAEGYRFDAPANALIGVTAGDTIYWYDAENAAAITRHADPLTLDRQTGAFRTAGGETVASPIQ